MRLLFIIWLITFVAMADGDTVQVGVFETHIAIEGKRYEEPLWQSLTEHFGQEVPPLVITGNLSFDEYSSILIEAEKRNIEIGLLTKPEKAE